MGVARRARHCQPSDNLGHADCHRIRHVLADKDKRLDVAAHAQIAGETVLDCRKERERLADNSSVVKSRHDLAGGFAR